MRVLVTSVVVLDVPNTHDVDALQREFLASNVWAIGRPMQTVSGVEYVLEDVLELRVVETRTPPRYRPGEPVPWPYPLKGE